MMELQISTVLFLVWNSIKDIRKKRISLASVVIFSILRLLCFVLDIMEIESDLLIETGALILGLIPGLVLCVIGKISRGALGIGDGIVVMMTGLYIGFKQTVMMIMWAFFLAFFWSVGMLVLKRYRPQSRFPFVPFLFTGLLINMCL